MFKKILIANRGEIACRVMRTAQRLGIRTVAVYSEADRNALHVEMADEAVAIGPAPAAKSYLSIEAIVAACKATGAEAVHPGYGFLSEREAFVEALDAAGIVFIGPGRRAIAAMGDKIESKKAAAAAGVSTVPGYLGVIADEDHAVAIARDIGYPVMIKASAGGGGKGMRVANNDSEAREGFSLARSEARSSFGDDRVFIEKFIVNPRHIEIQVIGDTYGSIVHLGERECSIQRRHQKVLEEAPSPLLDADTRAAMGAQAVALAKAVDYHSAGTVEFVAGQDKSFYFLEMNTRLQVEHPVTELVTGIDLVEVMIRVAAGERLPFTQKDIRLSGSAIEARAYAEDPTRGFLPSTGRLSTYRPPLETKADGITVRVDAGVVEGSEISIYYDPMIAKLCTHAPSRGEAITAMGLALDSFAIDGIRHNIPFLSALMRHPRWQEGRLSTGFIAEEFPTGFSLEAPVGDGARHFAAVAAAMDDKLQRRRRMISGQLDGPDPLPRKRIAMLAAEAFRIDVDLDGRETHVTFLDSHDHPTSLSTVVSDWKPGDPVWSGAVNGERMAFHVRAARGGFDLSQGGRAATVHIRSPREAELFALMPVGRATIANASLVSPMPGLVRTIAVAKGQEIRAGEVLLVVEAMKMENVLRAERDGTIKNILVSAGDSVAVDQVLIDFV